MDDLAVIDDPAVAGVSLDPVRARLLAELVEPGSATTLASKLALPRQKLNYHLRALEKHGLVELVEERRKGNCTERVLQASASAYVISPGVLAGVQPDPAVSPDGLSARWLLALAARTLREVGESLAGARKARRKLATFAIDGEIRFGSAADRAAFADELSASMASLVAKYHDETAPGGRSHRLLVAVHPKPSRLSGPTSGAER
jgi:DNA-binding transcriptional ArsR family regulator